MTNSYQVLQTVRITGTFTVNGSVTDPTTVTLKIKAPGGTISTYTYALAEVTKASIGVYYKDISVTADGHWFYRWQGTGAVAAADEDYFLVFPTKF